jgi:hypothetical protein
MAKLMMLQGKIVQILASPKAQSKEYYQSSSSSCICKKVTILSMMLLCVKQPYSYKKQVPYLTYASIAFYIYSKLSFLSQN